MEQVLLTNPFPALSGKRLLRDVSSSPSSDAHLHVSCKLTNKKHPNLPFPKLATTVSLGKTMGGFQDRPPRPVPLQHSRHMLRAEAS